MLKSSASPLVLALALAGTSFAPALAAEEVKELVVTAQKRDQSLKDAPVSVTVISGQTFADAGGHDVKALSFLTSGLIITSTANEYQTTARVRGVGTVGDNPGLESSVGVVIDGVARPRTGAAMNDLGEVAQIDVLKGPQSSLFGKGTSAGLIHVTTAAPTLKPFIALEATFGENGTKGGSIAAGGPIADGILGRIFVAHREMDGQYKVVTGQGPRTLTQDNGSDYWTGRGQVLFTPNAALKIRVIGDYTTRNEACCVGVPILVNAVAQTRLNLVRAGAMTTVANPGDRTAWSNRDTTQKIKDYGLSVQADYRLSDTLSLTSITAWREFKHDSAYDADFSAADLYYRDGNGGAGNHFSTLSEELRAAYRSGPLFVQGGIYLSRERLRRADQYLYGTDYERYFGLWLSNNTDDKAVSKLTGISFGQNFVSGLGAVDRHYQTSETAAVFVNGAYRLTPKLELSGDLRLTSEDKRVTSFYRNTDNGVACAAAKAKGLTGTPKALLCQSWSNDAFNVVNNTQSKRETAWAGSLKASYRLDEFLSLYASAARGWKPQGFNLDRVQSNLAVVPDTSFPAETVESYEIGAHGRYLSGKLAFDAAVFDEQFHDFQLNTFANSTFTVQSIPSLRTQGAEAELRLNDLLPGLGLSQGVTYAVTQFGKSAPGVLSGARAPFAPLWSTVSTLRYQTALSPSWVGRAFLSAKYNSSYNTGSDLAPIKLQPDYWLLNGRLVLAKADDGLSVELYANNLLDQRYYQVAFGAPLQTGSYGAFFGQPRQVGITLRLKR